MRINCFALKVLTDSSREGYETEDDHCKHGARRQDSVISLFPENKKTRWKYRFEDSDTADFISAQCLISKESKLWFCW